LLAGASLLLMATTDGYASVLIVLALVALLGFWRKCGENDAISVKPITYRDITRYIDIRSGSKMGAYLT
jgi:hypothetical protein